MTPRFDLLLAEQSWIDATWPVSSENEHAVMCAFDRLHTHVETYVERNLAPAPLPLDGPLALAEIGMLTEEIDRAMQEYHASHDEVVYRIGYLLFCVCLIERVELDRAPAHTLRSQVSGWLDAMLGLPILGALEIAIERYRRLCQGQDAEFVDRHILVPLAKRHLGLA